MPFVTVPIFFETNPGIRGKDDSPNSGRAASTQGWASGMPADFGSSTTSSWIYSIYTNYTPDRQDQYPELIGNPYMFTGRRFDLETGLYYYRARYYNPYIGRFLQTDPIGYADGINWYNYCANNPLHWLDPSGLATVAFYPEDDGDTDFEGWIDDGNFTYTYKVSSFMTIIDILSRLCWNREDINITDIYIFGHASYTYNSGGIEVPLGFYFEKDNIYYYNPTDGQASLEEAMNEFNPATWEDRLVWGGGNWNDHLPGLQNFTIHFRQCYVANERSQLQKLAEWTGRKVTGVAGAVGGVWEQDANGNAIIGQGQSFPGRPDYFFGGDLWETSPGANPQIIWYKYPEIPLRMTPNPY